MDDGMNRMRRIVKVLGFADKIIVTATNYGWYVAIAMFASHSKMPLNEPETWAWVCLLIFTVLANRSQALWKREYQMKEQFTKVLEVMSKAKANEKTIKMENGITLMPMSAIEDAVDEVEKLANGGKHESDIDI